MKLSIIIPAHNEEKRIGPTLEHFSRFYKEKKKNKELEDFEINVILNACKDNTLSVVKQAMKKCKEITFLNFQEGGKGFAVKQGFLDALKKDFDIIGFVDADLATSPQAFYDLVENIGDYDGIIASRYVQGAVVNPKQSLQRIIASRTFNYLARSFFMMPYRDTQCGAKVFKRNAIERIAEKIGLTKWAFDVDLLYKLKKNNMRVKEHPTVWSDKEYSNINLKNAGPSMSLALVRLRLLNSPFKDLVRAHDKINDYFKK